MWILKTDFVIILQSKLERILKMIRIRVFKQSGPGFEDIIKDIQMQFLTISEGLLKLGEETKTHMQTVIQTSKKRAGSKSKLENAIQVYHEKLPNRIDVGIGKISEMSSSVPYWYVVNYGGYSGAALSGKKVPGSFGGNPPDGAYKGTGVGYEKYDYSKGGPYFMKVESPMMAMNYIEKTVAWLNTVTRVHFANWTGKTKVV